MCSHLPSESNSRLHRPFFSAARLDALTVSALRAEVLIRIDLNSIDLWVARAIAPDALVRFWKRHANVKLSVFCSSTAHAKVYAGDEGFLVGSANLTVRGLSGTTDEILWRENKYGARKEMLAALDLYKARLNPISLEELEAYVEQHASEVLTLQKDAQKSPEDSLPDSLQRPARIGDYDAFLAWLARQNSSAAREIHARAHGRGQLSGHIRMNFFGIRQFLIANPAAALALRKAPVDSYALYRDAAMQGALSRFVVGEARSEGGLVVDTWRTYLPMGSGGKPKTGGGTSGNLNRMLPLMAKFLKV